MDREYVEGIAGLLKKPTPHIMNGLATYQCRAIPAIVDRRLKEAFVAVPSCMEYWGPSVEPCSPEEAYRFLTKQRSSKVRLELSKNDLYLVRYRFAFRGVEIPPKHIFLAFVRSGGLITIRDKEYYVTPEMQDPAFSVTNTGLFLHIGREKLAFERAIASYRKDGHKTSTHIGYCWMHSKARQAHNGKSIRKKMVPTMGHYIFAKLGFTEAMRIHGLCTPVVFTGPSDKYDNDDWVVVGPTGDKPTTLANQVGYRPTDIKVAIRKDEWSASAETLIACMYYVIDHYVLDMDLDSLDNPTAWQVLLGYINDIYDLDEADMIGEVREHLGSIEISCDAIAVDKLGRRGIKVEDIYDVLMYAMLKLHTMSVLEFNQHEAVWDKQFVTAEKLLSGLLENINMITWAARKKESHGGGINTPQDMIEIINANLKVGALEKIRDASSHPEATLVSHTGECSYINTSSTVLPQEKVGKKSRDSVDLDDPRNHASLSRTLLQGASLALKSNPTGTNMISSHANVDINGIPSKPTEWIPLIEEADARLSK